jgi:hypothetical protein
MVREGRPGRGAHGTTRRHRRATSLKVAVVKADDYDIPAGPPRLRTGAACRALQ